MITETNIYREKKTGMCGCGWATFIFYKRDIEKGFCAVVYVNNK